MDGEWSSTFHLYTREDSRSLEISRVWVTGNRSREGAVGFGLGLGHGVAQPKLIVVVVKSKSNVNTYSTRQLLLPV